MNEGIPVDTDRSVRKRNEVNEYWILAGGGEEQSTPMIGPRTPSVHCR